MTPKGSTKETCGGWPTSVSAALPATWSYYRPSNHRFDQFGAIKGFPVEDDLAERVICDALRAFMHMNMDAEFLGPRRRPYNCWRRRPDGVGAALVVVEVDPALRRLVSQILGKPVMKRFQRSGDDRPLAPGAVAPAVPAEVLPMRGLTEIAEIEVRVTVTWESLRPLVTENFAPPN